MTGYDLSRAWFDFAFENPEKINPNHAAIYFFAIEHCNRLGWREKFGFPTQMAMDALGIKKHQTYIKYFNDLVDWGFFKLIQKSQNQYSANIISLQSAIPKKGKALDKAIINHAAKQSASIGQSNSSINKPLTNKPQTSKRFAPPSFEDVKNYIIEREYSEDISSTEAQKFVDYYSSNGWKVGKNSMKDWKAAVRNWLTKVVKTTNGKPKIKPYNPMDELMGKS